MLTGPHEVEVPLSGVKGQIPSPYIRVELREETVGIVYHGSGVHECWWVYAIHIKIVHLEVNVIDVRRYGRGSIRLRVPHSYPESEGRLASI